MNGCTRMSRIRFLFYYRLLLVTVVTVTWVTKNSLEMITDAYRIIIKESDIEHGGSIFHGCV